MFANTPSNLQTRQFHGYQQKIREQTLSNPIFQRLQIIEGFDPNDKDNVQSTLVQTSRKLGEDVKKILKDNNDSNKIPADYLRAIDASRTKLLDPSVTAATRDSENSANQTLTTSFLPENTNLMNAISKVLQTIGTTSTEAQKFDDKMKTEYDATDRMHTNDNAERIANDMKVETIRKNYEMIMWFAVLIGTVFVGARIASQ